MRFDVVRRKALIAVAKGMEVPVSLLRREAHAGPEPRLRHRRPAVRRSTRLGHPDEKYARRRKARER